MNEDDKPQHKNFLFCEWWILIFSPQGKYFWKMENSKKKKKLENFVSVVEYVQIELWYFLFLKKKKKN